MAKLFIAALIICAGCRDAEIGALTVDELAELWAAQPAAAPGVLARLAQIKAQLESLAHLLEDKQTAMNVPAVQWGQSLEEVYLLVRFSVRHNLPACIEYRDLKIEVEGKHLTFEAVCGWGGQDVRYQLDVDLLWPLQGWERGPESRGEVILILKKEEFQWWLGFTAVEGALPSSRVWWNVKKHFPKAMAGYRAFQFKSQKEVERRLRKKNLNLHQPPAKA